MLDNKMLGDNQKYYRDSEQEELALAPVVPEASLQIPQVMPQIATVVKADMTRGDLSEAASGFGSSIKASGIAFVTPASRDLEVTRTGDTLSAIGGVQMIEPPEHPDRMLEIYDLSAYLAPIIDALLVGIFQTGWDLEARIDLSRPEKETKEKIREALEFELARGDFETEIKVGQREVNAEYKRLLRRSKRESQFMRSFFARCCSNMSYSRLLATSGLDQLITGNQYWEISRDLWGRPARLLWVPSRTIRAAKPDEQLVPVRIRAPLTDIRWENTMQYRRFNRWVQMNDNSAVIWFRSFGDPRVMSRYTGAYFDTLETMQSNETERAEIEVRTNGADKIPRAATELLHFCIPYPGSCIYGKPGHSASYPHLVGGREQAEENRNIVADEAIPSMIVLCSGGKVGEESQKRMEDQLKNRKRGRKEILFMNAFASGHSPTGPSATPTLKIEHTRPLQTNDALFLKYEERVSQVAHGVSRTPQVMVGNHAGMTKETMLGLRRLFEEDTCAPKRDLLLDDVINYWLLPALGIECWRYKSKSRPPVDPEALTAMISNAMESGWLTPDDARRLGGLRAFNEQLPELPGAWSELTRWIATAILQTKNQEIAVALMQRDSSTLESLGTLIKNLLEGKTKTGEDVEEDIGAEDAGMGDTEAEDAGTQENAE